MKLASSLKHRVTAMLMLAVVALIIMLALMFPPSQWIPAKQWGARLESAGPAGALLFVSIGALATGVGLPRQLLAFIGGLAYGILPGLLLALLAALSGCYLTVRLSTAFFSQWVRGRYPAFISQLNAVLQNDVFIKVLMLRLQPLGTNLLTNVCIGFTPVSRWRFLLASGIGYIPQMLIFVLLGSGIRVGSEFQGMLSIVLMAVSFLLGILIFRLHRMRVARAVLDSK